MLTSKMTTGTKHLNLVNPQIIPPRDQQMNFSNQGNTFGYMNSLGTPALGKHSRDSMDQLFAVTNSIPPSEKVVVNRMNMISDRFPASIRHRDILQQIKQYPMDMDAILSQHTKKIKLDLEQRQSRHAKLVVEAIREKVLKELNEKDDQIRRMEKLNSVLRERVKALFMENQLYKNLAQRNQATANTLRNNLEQVLSNVNKNPPPSTGPREKEEDDKESCCGSNGDGGREEEAGGRMCKRCEKKEATVLLLPCRHLCLCDVCGRGNSQLKACQVCQTHTSATLHVNVSSSP